MFDRIFETKHDKISMTTSRQYDRYNVNAYISSLVTLYFTNNAGKTQRF